MIFGYRLRQRSSRRKLFTTITPIGADGPLVPFTKNSETPMDGADTAQANLCPNERTPDLTLHPQIQTQS
jgi:hypothetical protein